MYGLGKSILNTSVETAVWTRATERYGADLGRILDSAISTYQRVPGLESPSRLYAQDIGEEGIDALHQALLRNRASQFHVLNSGIEMRHSLRLHLVYCLRQHLVNDGDATHVMRDQHFAAELGL